MTDDNDKALIRRSLGRNEMTEDDKALVERLWDLTTEIAQVDKDAAAAYLEQDGNDWPLQDLVLIKNALFCATEDPSLEEARRILYAMVPILDRHREAARMEERDAIVAWMRRHKIGNFPFPVVETLEISSRQKALVDAIEAGEHLK